jgi:HSP20 family protein
MTALLRWAPFGDLELVDRRMRRVFEDFGIAPGQLPAADLYETDTEFVVELDVPGFDEKDLALEVTDHTLTVKGERVQETEDAERTFHLHERLEKHFERKFTLPADVDLDRVKATFEVGVLEVRVPKMELAKPRKIEIAA